MSASEDFREAMYDGGVPTTAAIIGDGKMRRVYVEGDKRGTRNGWYVFHDDEVPAGAYGNWKGGINERWCAKNSRDPDLSAEQRRAWQEKRDARRKQQDQDIQERRVTSRQRASQLWGNAEDIYGDEHPYLKEKHVKSHGLRVSQAGQLLIPMYNSHSIMTGIQRVNPDGDKRFLTGSEPIGSYFPIVLREQHETVRRPRLIIAEGYATGATIHEATGSPVAVAFNCGNLLPVAKSLRAKMGDEVEIVIAADNDRGTEGNPGLTHAQEAAKAVNGRVAVPRFYAGEKGTDFNDIWYLRGPGAIRAEMNELWDFRDLYATEFPEPVWVVRDILPTGLAIAVGDPKSGKSRLCTNIGLAVAAGGAAVGWSQWKARKSGVIYLDLEQGPRGSRDRFADLMPDNLAPDGLTVAHEWPSMGDGCIRKLRRHLRENPEVKLVIVDTLANVWDDSNSKHQNAYHREYEVLTRFKKLAEEAECSVLLIHHTNKAGGDDALQTTSGTRAMTGVPDVLWFLKRNLGEPGATFSITGREVKEQKHKLTFAADLGTWSVSQEAQQAAWGPN